MCVTTAATTTVCCHTGDRLAEPRVPSGGAAYRHGYCHYCHTVYCHTGGAPPLARDRPDRAMCTDRDHGYCRYCLTVNCHDPPF